MRILVIVAVAAVLALAPTSGAWAHKEKLPSDALTLVRQASALLAQDPGMAGEARERVEAALESKQTAGVHIAEVADALRALEGKNISTARRLLMAAIMPAGMPMPPQGLRGQVTPLPPIVAAPGPSSPATSAGPAGPPSVETAMTMAQPLRIRFGATKPEMTLLVAGLLLAGVGLVSLVRSRETVS